MEAARIGLGRVSISRAEKKVMRVRMFRMELLVEEGMESNVL